MEKYIYDEQNGLTYILVGDYYLPDLLPPQEAVPAYGKYGVLRLKYLKEHKRPLYTSLVTQGRFIEDLNNIDEGATRKVEAIVEIVKVQHGVTEELKVSDQMKRVGLMNNIKSLAEEMVLNGMVYK